MALNKFKKQSILLFADWFEPGFKAGGPIRSCLNFATQMKDEYDIYVLTTDRDFKSFFAYDNIVVDKWTVFEPGINIFYCSPSNLNWANVLHQLKTVKPDFVYMNSMYSKYFTVYPLLMYRFGLFRSKIVLAPRGMVKSTAVKFKSLKKLLFFRVMRLMRLSKGVKYHATDKQEMIDIRKRLGADIEVSTIPNFPVIVKNNNYPIAKNGGEVSLIFVGRLHPIKNLDYLLRLLPAVKGGIHVSVLGNEEDSAYVSLCRKIASELPANIRVDFLKELPYKKLVEVVRLHHFFVLPTQGENFGHAIFEAMAEGKPVLISDQTPWRDLARIKAGWDVSLSNKQEFISSLQRAVEFTQLEYNEWSDSVWRYAKNFSQSNDLKTPYLKLFS